MLSLKQLILENSIEWKSPSIKGCEQTIQELSDELFVNKNSIINSFKNGTISYLPKSKIEKIINVNMSHIQSFLDITDFIHNKQKSNPEYIRDWMSIKNCLQKKEPIEAPVMMKYKNDYYLLDGQIRLMVAKVLNVSPKIYVFYLHG